MRPRILIMTDLDALLREADPRIPLRLNLIQSTTAGASGTTNVTVSLCLQGVNDHDDTMWMQESYSALRIAQSWLSETSQQIFDLYPAAHDMLKSYLADSGYLVRPGRYGIPDDIKPVNCRFPLWDFRKDADGKMHLVPVTEA